MSRRSLVTLSAAGVVVRLAFLSVWFRDYVPRSDAQSYDLLARSVAHGEGLSATFPFFFEHATAFRAPLYPLLLGGVYRLTGDSVLAGMLANAVLGVVAVVLIALLAASIGGREAGLAAGWVALFYPPLLANDVVLLTEPLSLVLLMATLLALVRGRDAWAGLWCGLLMLTRPSAQAFVLVLAVWFVRHYGVWRAVRFVLVAVVVLAPWLTRNWIEVGAPTLVTSNGFNLAAIHSEPARDLNGFINPLVHPALAEVRRWQFTEIDLDAALRGEALREIRTHLWTVPRILGTNLLHWIEATPFENDNPERLDGRVLGVRHAALPAFYVVSGAGAFGLVLARRRAGAQLALSSVAYFTLASIVTVAPPRLRAPVDAAMCVGVGVTWAWWRARGRRDARVHWSMPDPAVPSSPAARLRVRRSVAAMMAVAVVVGVAAVGARAVGESDASGDARDLVAENRSAIEEIAGIYPIDGDARELPPIGIALRSASDFEVRVWRLVPRLGGDERTAARRLGRELHAANSELTTLTLMTIAGRREDAARFRVRDLADRYEREIRTDEESLPPWDGLLAGENARGTLAALERLEQRLR